MRWESVTVVTPGKVADPYAGEEETTEPTEVEVTRVMVEPRPSSEPVQDARNAVVSGFTLYMPPGTPVTASQLVRVRGETYQVLGDPADWQVGVVVQVGRTEG
jgi:hypothetical protein